MKVRKSNHISFFSDHRYLVLTILISCIPFLFIFLNSNLFHTHDGLVHIPRIGAYVKALKDGMFPVRWAGDLNYGYGLPIFNFAYPLPYIISSLFVLLGLGLVTSFKISLFLSFLFSGIFMYLFANSFFQDKRKAFLITLFYQFATFRFVELFVRGSFGEVYTYTFLPLVLYGLTLLFQRIRYRAILITSLGTFLLILSHNAISLAYFGICVLFVLCLGRSIKKMVIGMLSLILGLLLGAFYWIPAILEHKYTYGDLFMKDLYKDHFAPLQNFFIPNFTNAEAFQVGGISIQIGILHVIGILMVIYLLFFRKGILKQNIRLIFYLSLFLTLAVIFFMQPVSKVFWEKIPLLRQFQFPWRLLSVIVFSSAITSAGFLFFKLSNKVYILLCVLVIVISAGYWIKAPLGYDKINESYYWNFPLNTTYYGETDLVWSAGPAKKYPKSRVEVIEGKAEISNFKRKTQLHTFSVNASSTARIVDNMQYYPGWVVLVNSKPVIVQYQDPNWRGLVTFDVPAGKSSVQVIFQENKLRLFSDAITILSFVIVVVLAVPVIKKKYEEK